MAVKTSLICLTSLLLGVLREQFVMAADPAVLEPAIEKEEEQQVIQTHKIDSSTILMLLGLLLLTILTIWFFKFRRFRFVHESGLSMIYGMIVGVIIRYASFKPDTKPPHVKIVESGNVSYSTSKAPESVLLDLKGQRNGSITVQYNIWGEVSEEEQQLSQLVMAVTFDPELFFNVLLPFIIFEAGYSMKRRHFFRNLGSIMAFAFVGTTISCVVVGGIMYGVTRLMDISFTLNDCFFFGAIISATDPVTVLAIFSDLKADVDLFAFIFGESVLNDAVAIVLSGAVETYGSSASKSGESKGFSVHAFFSSLGNFVGIFAGAFAIGSLIGCFTALLTKYTKIRDFPLLETAMFFLMSYMSFQACEAAGLTGIVAVLFCGITQAHYTYNNLSVESKLRTKQLFELMNFLAENFVFLYIGVAVFTFHSQEWNILFILSAIMAIFIARFFNIYPLSLLLNLGRKNKITRPFMHMMMFSGLRGAIAFALAIRNTATEARKLMVSATMIIVIVTVILGGGLTTPMLGWLQIRVGVEEEKEMTNFASPSGQENGRKGKWQRQYSTMENMRDDSQSQTQEDSNSQQVLPLLKGNAEETESKKRDKAYLVGKWHNFDVRILKPILTHSRPTLMETLPACCMPLARLLTTEEQMAEGRSHIEEDSDTDMIIDHRELSIGEGSSSNISAAATPQPDFQQVEIHNPANQPIRKCKTLVKPMVWFPQLVLAKQ
ncbi:sodium/hydrogen exchanger 9-like isoform X3 [Ostrea edulis]|uniref:sodium/hydrogen exchanger 9-like isoform X3 n=1 Tax=Ostrea edulis TaxID=37623 RepID=UPI0024AEE5E1|nr:sodium/hydrogen exchanger 9-like isoform X3 [Ostrea edulis]